MITTAEGFAAMDANGSYELGKDITITTPYSSAFSGTFDGKGHTVTLAISSAEDGSRLALFSKLASTATVKNLQIEGSVTYSGTDRKNAYVGSIAAECEGTVTNCKNNAEISGYSYIGGIAGVLTGGQIVSCANKGDVKGINGESRYIGGIAGQACGEIRDCYNQGAITSERGSRVHLGGISGSLESGNYSVQNCYNRGSIAVKSNSAAIVGWHTGKEVLNCYFVETDGLAGTNGSGKSETSSKTLAEMKSADFVTLLGSAFRYKAGDFPALSWETPTASVQFNITPEDAVLTINGATYTGSCNVALPAGTHDYMVSLDGYTTQSGTVTVTENEGVLTADQTRVGITLPKDDAQLTDVHFTVTPDTATFELKDGETTVQPSAESQFTLSLIHISEPTRP